jgi:signal peptidase II
MGKHLLKYFLILMVMLGGCSADFHTKKWANNNIRNRQSITIVKNFIDLGLAQNRGMIFGIFNGKIPLNSKMILTVFRCFLLLIISFIIWSNRKKSIFSLLPFLLFWAGATGNIIDPFLYGYVVDFIHIRFWQYDIWPFYFNLADAYITIGMIVFLLLSLAGIDLFRINKATSTDNQHRV